METVTSTARRELVPFEVAAVLGVAIAWTIASPGLPAAVPLVIAASASRYLRGGSWSELMRGGNDQLLVGAVAGGAALVVAVLVATPAVEAIADRSVEWSAFPVVRGSAVRAGTVAVLVAALSVASELAMRGWIVERVAELSRRSSRVMPVLVGAIAEAAVTSGDAATRLGAAAFGAGLSWLYFAAGRSLTAPIAARVAFQLGAVLLEAFRVVG
jgi:hypothetical protein